MSVGGSEHPSGVGGAGRQDARPAGQVSFLDQALWKQFNEAANQEAFVQAWIALQCRLIPGAASGVVVLRQSEDDPFVPAAYWPDKESCSQALASAAEVALSEGRGVVQNDEASGSLSQSCSVAYPLRFDDEVSGVVAIEVQGRDSGQLRSSLRQLQWGASWVEVMLLRRRERERQGFLDRASSALDIVATALSDQRFRAACNATVTELALRLNCDQVSIGFVKGGHATVAAVSHAAQFGRRMNLIRDIGAAMDEAIDQMNVVLYPPPPAGEYCVTRAHAELARAHGAGAILTIPLGDHDAPYGALSFQRPPGDDFDQPAIDVCDAVAAVVGPILKEKQRNDRWILRKVLESVAVQARRLLGPGYLGRKLALASFAALALFFGFAKGDYRVTSPAVLEGLVQRVIVAPFDGYIAKEESRAGAIVKKGQVLAALDDKDLALERLRWSTTRRQRLTEFDRALAVTAVQRFGNGLVIGLEDFPDPRRALGRVEPVVAGDLGGLAPGRHGVGPIRGAVAVDHQARIGLQCQRRVEPLRHVARNRSRAYVPGDVARQVGLVQPQIAQALRDPVARVVAGQEKGRTAARVLERDRRRLVLAEELVFGV